MQVKFVGTGGAFDYRYGNSAAVVWFRDMKILVDCGADVFTQLRQKGHADDITHVLITHLHDDHGGSLGSLLAYHTLILRKPRLKLIYPTESFHRHLGQFLTFIISVDQHVEFLPMDAFEGLHYIDTFGLHVKDFPTFAYYFTEGTKTIAYSGDLGDPDVVFGYLHAQGLTGCTVYHDITFNRANRAHAFYKDVAKHTDDFEVFGYHVDPTEAPPDNSLRLVHNHPELLL
jgi:ribonuclease BN (tRNA processing enzyme)